VDFISGCDLLCFLDAYSGFYQIPMSREDEENTTFMTVDGLFCYVSIAYGLKNTLPTFVRAMHKTFGDLIRDNLALVFDKLRLTHAKMNPDKCVFGVTMGKLLGFLLLYRGIEANPEKIGTIEAMQPPARIKDVQSSRDVWPR
jgi:hypothetical protein